MACSCFADSERLGRGASTAPRFQLHRVVYHKARVLVPHGAGAESTASHISAPRLEQGSSGTRAGEDPLLRCGPREPLFSFTLPTGAG